MSTLTLRAAVLAVLIASDVNSLPAQTPEGQPPASGREPGLQQEKDWVDNRWNRTDVGPFLASNLSLPGGAVAKGLSIRVGSTPTSTMAYDTATCSLRGFWTGGFLDFDPGRFGFIQAPRIPWNPMVFGPSGSGWLGGSNHHRALHLHGSRVVLDYLAGDVAVLESPSTEGSGDARVFCRTFEIAPALRPMTLRLASNSTLTPPPGAAVGPIALQNTVATVTVAGKALAVGMRGTAGELARDANGDVVLRLPASATARRFKLTFATLPTPGPTDLAAAVRRVSDPENLHDLLKPGPARWLPELVTTGQRGGESDLFAVDTLTVPYDNPWKALFFNAGVDFTADGSAYVCTIHGDVWRVQGIDAGLTSLRWKRFATGLFQPLGLKVRDGAVYVLGRDQITRLRDDNGDGEADTYENFCNLIQTSTGGHDYVTSLEKDIAGNFYFVDPVGVHRVSRDGRTMETLATGFRNPNGLGVSPDASVITAAPQQGTWTPSSQICAIKPGGYYGYGGPRVQPNRPAGYDEPLCWIPHGVDNSSGSQVWVPRDSWGPLGGQMLHLLWGRCGMMLVLRDQVGAMSQGAVVPLPVKFLSGPNRGSFHPTDGHLYVAGSTGWQTSAVKDGALQRVRFLNKPSRLPVGWHAHRNGLILSFGVPLERSAAEDPGSYAVKQWNYRYAEAYGSKDWSVTDPSREGRDALIVKSATLLPDGKRVFLDLGELRPVMQMEVKYSLNGAQGLPIKSQLWLTLNQLDGAF